MSMKRSISIRPVPVLAQLVQRSRGLPHLLGEIPAIELRPRRVAMDRKALRQPSQNRRQAPARKSWRAAHNDRGNQPRFGGCAFFLLRTRKVRPPRAIVRNGLNRTMPREVRELLADAEQNRAKRRRAAARTIRDHERDPRGPAEQAARALQSMRA